VSDDVFEPVQQCALGRQILDDRFHYEATTAEA
jgi:hypothetical protein